MNPTERIMKNGRAQVSVKNELLFFKDTVVYAIIFYLVIFTGVSAASIYYVDINGSDQNSGSYDKPWQTLHYAVKSIKSYDTIFVKNGTYNFENSLSLVTDSITIMAYPKHKPIIKYIGPVGNAININAKNITVSGITVVWSTTNLGNIIGVNAQYATIRGCHIYYEVKTSKYDAIKINSTASYSVVDGCEIHEAPNQGVDTVGANNLIIKNNIIYNCQNAIVLKGGSSDDLIENNFIYDSTYGAIGLGGYTDSIFNSNQFENMNSIVRNNIIYYANANNIGGGIFLWGAQGAQVYHNTIVGSGVHIRSGGDPAKSLYVSKNNQILNNIFWTTGNDGIIRVDTGNDSGLLLRNNLYWANPGLGLFEINEKWINDYVLFKAQVGYDIDSIFQNPNFVDFGSKNFTLSTTSPAVGKAYPVLGFSSKGDNIGVIDPSSIPNRPWGNATILQTPQPN
jgi:hypothetical protein